MRRTRTWRLKRVSSRQNRPYRIPGPELLPPAELDRRGLRYVEEGPAGWEHLAVLVSMEPLVHPSVLGRANRDSPFVELSEPDLQNLVETLSSADGWVAGILSFLVQ